MMGSDADLVTITSSTHHQTCWSGKRAPWENHGVTFHGLYANHSLGLSDLWMVILQGRCVL